MKRIIMILVVGALCVACGGGSDGAGEISDSVTASQVQISQAVQSAMNSGLTSSPSVSSKALSFEGHAKNIALQQFGSGKNTNTPLTFNCPSGGTATLSIEDNSLVNADGATGTADMTFLFTLDNCSNDNAQIVTSGDQCNYSVAVDGQIACSITGQVTTSTVNLSAHCGTPTLCNGVDVTINGDAHTYGYAASVSVSGATADVDADFGTLIEDVSGMECIDGVQTPLNLDAVIDASTSVEALLCSE